LHCTEIIREDCCANLGVQGASEASPYMVAVRGMTCLICNVFATTGVSIFGSYLGVLENFGVIFRVILGGCHFECYAHASWQRVLHCSTAVRGGAK